MTSTLPATIDRATVHRNLDEFKAFWLNRITDRQRQEILFANYAMMTK